MFGRAARRHFAAVAQGVGAASVHRLADRGPRAVRLDLPLLADPADGGRGAGDTLPGGDNPHRPLPRLVCRPRSEEHTSELQSLMRNSYAVFCLKKKTKSTN